MRWGLLHGVAFFGAIACQGGSFFVCNDDVDCTGDGEQGLCQATGACSFPDQECDSGQRYGEGSPPALAGECVMLDEGSTGTLDSDTSSDSAADSADDTSGVGCPPDWWDCAWGTRQRLDLQRPVDGPLVDVPVLILLTDGRVDHEQMQADGEDVRFVSATGAVLPYEIERWDPEGISILWTTVDALGGSDDHIWLYYDNPVAENAQDQDAVWPAPFAGVWHLEDDPLDASGNENHALPTDATDIALGQIANGRDYIGGSARLDVEASPSLADAFAEGATVSAWIRPRSWGGNGYGRIVHKSDDVLGWLLYVAPDGALRFSIQLGLAEASTWETPIESLAVHTWTHVAVTYDPRQLVLPSLYINGSPRQLAEPAPPPEVDPATIPSDVDIPLTVGNRPDNNRRFNGVLDEIRIETTARSPEWIEVQYDATRDELFEYGPIESHDGA